MSMWMKRGARPTRRRVHDVPDVANDKVVVEWYEKTYRAACNWSRWSPILYAFADPGSGLVDYVGITSRGLAVRYGKRPPARCEGKRIFVAFLDSRWLEFVEHSLIFYGLPMDNERGRATLPLPHIWIVHRFHGAGDGPGFCRPGTLREWGTGRILS
jgi:hypothetical protein